MVVLKNICLRSFYLYVHIQVIAGEEYFDRVSTQSHYIRVMDESPVTQIAYSGLLLIC